MEIHEVPFINMDDGDAPWMAWTDWLAAGGVELQRQPGRVLFQNYPMVVQQALIGRGVALGWRGLIDELVDGGALTVVGPEVTSARGYYVVWPKNRRSVEIDALVAWLRTEAAS